MQFARPVEGSIPEEEEIVEHQRSQWAHNLRVFLSDSWRRDRVKHEQAHLEYFFLPEDSLGSLFGVRVCGKEPEVVGQVELQELDVLLILTDRLKLSLDVIDSFNLHDFLSDLGRHRERFEQREQKLSLFVAIVLGSLLSVSLHK